MRSLLFIVLLFGLVLRSGRSELSQLPQRQLKLDCPIDEYNDIGDTSGESYEGRFDSYSKGALGRSWVENIRKKPEAYYQGIVDTVVMLLCDVETASERCVDESLAAKDWSGSCIKAADYEVSRVNRFATILVNCQI